MIPIMMMMWVSHTLASGRARAGRPVDDRSYLDLSVCRASGCCSRNDAYKQIKRRRAAKEILGRFPLPKQDLNS